MPNIKIPALLAAISSPSLALAIEFTETDIAWRKQSALKDQALLDYSAERMSYNNSIRLDEKGNCYTKAKGKVTLILVINKQGVIESVASDVNNEKSKCFINAYLGSTYKAPPSAPFYDKLIMGH
jgi:hypothetical protein